MSATIDQKAYLQKYLGGASKDKKKKKKKAVKGKGFKIIDDDIDLNKLRPLDGDELDILDQGEDAPQIAGIIDERPEDLKKLEQFQTSSRWRVVNHDDGFNSKLQIEEIKQDVKQAEKENELIFGKMYSDSEDEKKNDSDLSPPRKSNDNQNTDKPSRKHNSDSDFSPPRKTDKPSKPHKNDSNSSNRSPRNETKSRDRVKKSRWGDRSPDQSTSKQHRTSESPKKSRKNYDSDESPPRKSKKNYDSDVSPPRKSRNMSPPTKSRKDDSDAASPRKSRKDYNSDATSPRKSKRSYDYDTSPSRKSKKKHFNTEMSPRKSKIDSRKRIEQESDSPSKRRKSSPQMRNHSDKPKKHRLSPDSDISPPRKNKRQKSLSPVRKSKKHSLEKNNKRKYNSDSDESPPRREKDRSRAKNVDRKDSPPPSNKKMAKTLEGKSAGLQDARQLREENAEFRKKEDAVFSKMTDDVSGRNAQVVSRKSKRETSEDRQKQREKAERQKELDEKYKKWSKGIKQVEDQESRVQEFLHEASKPLARHRDDRDLEMNLKQVEREGDPMLQYIKGKKRERGELGPEKPSYKGSFPPNRFNIRPGYRWDGVDRSNGYEKKYFDTQSKKKALEEDAYKWSTEDL